MSVLAFLATFFLVLTFVAPLAAAETTDRDFALPGDTVCPISLPEPGPAGTWTDAERWAWDQVCRGRWANMSLAGPDGNDGLPCNPADIESEVPAHRVLRPEFLQLILTRARWVEVLAKPQVNIRCAHLERKLDLENAHVKPALFLANSHLPAGAILRNASFDHSLSFQGSTFEGLFDADGLSLGGDLVLQGGASFQEVRLLGAQVVGDVNAISSTFEGLFYADRLSVGGALFLRGGASFQEVRLLGAQVVDDVDAIGSTFDGLFNAHRLSVGGNLFLRGEAWFQEVNLTGAQVGGNVETTGSTFEGLFRASTLSVGDDLYFRDGVFFQEVQLYGAQVRGSVSTVGSYFASQFCADRLEVDGNLTLGDGTTFQGISIRGAQVGGNVTAIGSTLEGPFIADYLSVGRNLFLRAGGSFQQMALSGAVIEGHLQLAGSRFKEDFDFSGGVAQELVLFRPGTADKESVESDDPIWNGDARLILRNAKVTAVQSRAASWQRDGLWIAADLTGFKYERLAGFRGETSPTLLDAKAEDLIAWLEGTNLGTDGYDPQPYEQLADVLEDAGMTTKAKAVRYAKFRHRDLSQSGYWWEVALLRPASRFIIGYGVYPFLALVWFGVLVVVGVIIAFFSRAALIRPWYRKIWYSLENALPLVEFSEGHKSINHRRCWVESWFHFQKVMGFVLATVLVAALSLLGA